MRNTTLQFIGIFAVVTASFFSACTDPCKDINCDKGTCADGLCLCDAGYEGTLCDTRITNKFVGNFDLSEYCTTANSSYPCSITESSSELMEINIYNLYASSMTFRAIVNEDGISFTIPAQTIGSAIISGSGSINTSGSTITINYTVAVGTLVDACTATLTRI